VPQSRGVRVLRWRLRSALSVIKLFPALLIYLLASSSELQRNLFPAPTILSKLLELFVFFLGPWFPICFFLDPAFRLRLSRRLKLLLPPRFAAGSAPSWKLLCYRLKIETCTSKLLKNVFLFLVPMRMSAVGIGNPYCVLLLPPVAAFIGITARQLLSNVLP